MWNFDRWKWATLSDIMRVEVLKPNDLFPSLCDFRCKPISLPITSLETRYFFVFVIVVFVVVSDDGTHTANNYGL
jgi:hypothetical protein